MQLSQADPEGKFFLSVKIIIINWFFSVNLVIVPRSTSLYEHFTCSMAFNKRGLFYFVSLVSHHHFNESCHSLIKPNYLCGNQTKLLILILSCIKPYMLILKDHQLDIEFIIFRLCFDKFTNTSINLIAFLPSFGIFLPISFCIFLHLFASIWIKMRHVSKNGC